MPIVIPSGVTVTLAEGNLITVKGPKGTLTQELHKDMIIENDAESIIVKRPSEIKAHKALHGLTRTLNANMVLARPRHCERPEVNGGRLKGAKQGKQLLEPGDSLR
jgi:large subunit ribosomal protein L6